MDIVDAALAYWNDRAVTQKSNDPAVARELAWNWMFGVLGAPVSAVPVVGAQHLVLNVVQGMVWVAAFITAQ
jgi:hypothetical protein